MAFEVFYGDVFSDYCHGVDLKECVRRVSPGVLENNCQIFSSMSLIEQRIAYLKGLQGAR